MWYELKPWACAVLGFTALSSGSAPALPGLLLLCVAVWVICLRADDRGWWPFHRT